MLIELLHEQQKRRGASFRVPHFSIQRDHLHLIVEADDGELTSGIRSFLIRFARKLNRLFGRKKGKVWGDRYHRRDLASPTETRNALIYVLNNDAKHGLRKASTSGPANIDIFSSGPLFDGWCVPTTRITYAVPWPDMRPRTWFLREGWRRKGGGPVDPRKTPGPRSL